MFNLTSQIFTTMDLWKKACEFLDFMLAITYVKYYLGVHN